MLSRLQAPPGGLHTDEFDRRVVVEGVEQADTVTAAADAGHQVVRQAVVSGQDLLSGFLPDDDLEVAHYHRVGVRADHGAEQVIGVPDITDPIADGLVDGVFQRPASGGHRAHFRTHQLHAVDVGRLAADILISHVDDTFQAEHGAGRRRGDAVLAGAGLGNDSLFTHAPGQQCLPYGIVNLVGAGMRQVFPFQQDGRPADFGGQLPGRVEGGGSADVLAAQSLELLLEIRVRARCGVGRLKLVKGGHQCLGDKLAAVLPEVAARVRISSGCHHISLRLR